LLRALHTKNNLLKQAPKMFGGNMRYAFAAAMTAFILVGQSAWIDASAQTYPDRAIKMIVPFPPGGATDVTGRIIADAMSASLGQPVVVENRPGAAATIGIDLVAKSKPDGYTLGVAGVGPTAIIPLLDPKLSYQPLRDLDMIAGLNVVDMVFVALPGLKQTSLKDVLDAARAEPDKLSYATPGVAGPAHLDFSNLAQLAGIKMIHVPFAGDSPAITAVLTGDVTIALVSVAAATPFLTSGKLKGLAAGGPDRLKLLPDLTTAAEQTGFKNYDANVWSVLVAARGTPNEILVRLNKAVNEALAKPEVKAKLEDLGLKALPGDQKWTQEFVAAKIARNKRIIEVTGLKRE